MIFGLKPSLTSPVNIPGILFDLVSHWMNDHVTWMGLSISNQGQNLRVGSLHIIPILAYSKG